MPAEFQRIDDIPNEVLAALARCFLIDPLSPDQTPRLEGLDDREMAALELLLGAVRIPRADIGQERPAQLKLLGEISRLLGQQTPEKRQQAAGRLSDRGLLPPSSYKVEFSKEWEATEAFFSERQSQILDVISEPSLYRHLVPENRGVADFPGVTLLAKGISPKRSRPFVMLVVAERLATTLRVRSAWRLPTEFVPPLPDPFNLLERFVGDFGVFVTIPGRPARQLIHYDTVLAGQEGASKWSLVVQNPDDEPVVRTAVYRIGDQGQIEVALAFAISVNRYRLFLKTLKDTRP